LKYFSREGQDTVTLPEIKGTRKLIHNKPWIRARSKQTSKKW